jgi:hypothetical protein
MDANQDFPKTSAEQGIFANNPPRGRFCGNVTGISVDTGPTIWDKRIELLHEIFPATSRLAFLAPHTILGLDRRRSIEPLVPNGISPVIFLQLPPLGRLLAEWGKPPAECLFLLPLWHPVLMAEQIGALAAIAQGPFIMQCGLGWGETRFVAMGANIRTRPSAFEEALDIVRRLLAGETVSSSRRFRVAEASLALRPAEPVEVWIGASTPPAIDHTARLAEGWIASPGLTFEEARSQADIYRERCAAYGRQPNAITLRRDIYVGESSSEAQAVL